MLLSTGTSPATAARPRDHLVGFYDTKTHLADSVATFLAQAFQEDGFALVIATSEHHAEFAAALAARGVEDVAGDRYVQLDAAATLASVMRNGSPDPELFRAVLEDVTESPVRAGRPVYAYGEMVALLWEDGDAPGAMRLEELWNQLLASHPLALFCGYPTSAFSSHHDTAAFRAVCDAHSAVVPSEGFAELTDPTDRLRRVAILEQQAVASANERDSLQRKQQELETALAQLAEADRARREFAAMVIHEVRSPTAVISGFLELLQASWSELHESQVREYLSSAARSAAQVGRLIDDLLLMSRLESGRFRYELGPVDLPALAAEAVSQVRSATGRTVEVVAPGGLPTGLADEGRQLQILANLLSNAVKFSVDATPVSVIIEDGGDHLVVRVRDRGVGIAPAELPELFRPFSRLRGARGSQTGGTGLGLWITKALVEGQGGMIDVASRPGVGTTFTYTIPLLVASPPVGS